MKLEQLGENFIYLERFVNDIKHSSTADYSEVHAQFHPKRGAPVFELPVFSVSKNLTRKIEASPSRSAKTFIRDKKNIRMFCHPDSVNDFTGIHTDSQQSMIEVSPTSSTRTVIPIKHPEVMLKTHLGVRISHFVRRLRGSSIDHSVRISRECEKIANNPLCPKEFAFLPESIGIIHTGSDLGYIVRESSPRPHAPDARILIPFFSLYSHDSNQAGDPPILTQLITRQTLEPLAYFEKNILDPFMKTWAFAFLEHGLLFESHAQNTLLELDTNFQITRVVQRDFQSVPVDPIIRKAKKLKLPFKKHIIGSGDYPRIIEHSLQYDRFIGYCMFRAFALFFKNEFDIEETLFYASVQKIFRKYIPAKTEKEFFPPGYFMLADVPATNNSYPLVYYHEKPPYRPSY